MNFIIKRFRINAIVFIILSGGFSYAQTEGFNSGMFVDTLPQYKLPASVLDLTRDSYDYGEFRKLTEEEWNFCETDKNNWPYEVYSDGSDEFYEYNVICKLNINGRLIGVLYKRDFYSYNIANQKYNTVLLILSPEKKIISSFAADGLEGGLLEFHSFIGSNMEITTYSELYLDGSDEPVKETKHYVIRDDGIIEEKQ